MTKITGAMVQLFHRQKKDLYIKVVDLKRAIVDRQSFVNIRSWRSNIAREIKLYI